MSNRRLPVTYKTQDGVHAASSEVVIASEKDMDQYGNVRTTCAMCRNFRYEAGQNAMQRENFLGRLVHEEQWKVGHLGAPPSTFGLCGLSNDTLTSMHTKACEQYAPQRGRIREPGDWNR